MCKICSAKKIKKNKKESSDNPKTTKGQMRIDKDHSHLYCLCSGVFTRHYAYDSKVLCL